MSLLLQWLFVALSLVLPGCEGREEDEPNLYWDTEACGIDGDGHGQSFVSVELTGSYDLIIFDDGSFEISE